AAAPRLAEDFTPAVAGRLQAGDQRRRGPPAAASRSDHGAALACLDRQIEVAQRRVHAARGGQEALRDTAKVDGWSHSIGLSSESAAPATDAVVVAVLVVLVAQSDPG